MQITIWILQGILAASFAVAGLAKLGGAESQKEWYEHWRLPQGFRIVTGLVESTAAALLIIGYWLPQLVMYGALLLVFVGIGGLITHMRISDPAKDMIPIATLGLFALALFLLTI